MSTESNTANPSGAAPSVHITPEMVKSYRRSRLARLRLTPEVLSRQLEQFDAGSLREFALTADALPRRDDRIAVAWPKRCKAVSRRGYVIQINDGLEDATKARAELHQAALKYAYDNCTAAHALDLNKRGGWRLLARQMMEALGVQYAVHELVFQPRLVDGRPQMTFTAHHVPLWFFENSTGRLRFLREQYALEGQPMADNEWLVTVADEALMQPLAIARCFKQMSLVDWLAYSEKFGMPGLLGKTGAQKDSPAWAAMQEAVADFGQEWAAVCSTNDTIDLVEAAGGQNMPYPTLVDRMDRAIVSICVGGDLSTMSQQGDAVGALPQAEAAEAFEEDDALMIEESVRQISRFIIRELFDEEPLAYLQIVIPKAKDATVTKAKIEILVDRGVPVGADWARQELGVPAPADGEAVLQASAAAAPGSGFGVPGFGTQLSALNPQLSSTFAAANAAEGALGTLFRDRALVALSDAQRERAAPLLERVAALKRADTPAAYAAALRKLQADLPKLAAPILADPVLAKAIELTLGPAFASGLASASTPNATQR
ncbi:phage portal protein family protein [Opitutus terrae]|uniref:Mu-like protein prophage protein gp29-like protein n=1 Tax=Opitutus terrae (strain DSM 11246 / JCM 15787 / PB90-1) TaxID=452637 RepID=B1ZV27_OPITP|nr:DUF935 family protein [Opitutus terrae]ACB76694.1 Mu-like protein prophage protein gp29-like protein [Opitutus terrae PB90-1]